MVSASGPHCAAKGSDFSSAHSAGEVAPASALVRATRRFLQAMHGGGGGTVAMPTFSIGEEMVRHELVQGLQMEKSRLR